jgi:hypothetical protein
VVTSRGAIRHSTHGFVGLFIAVVATTAALFVAVILHVGLDALLRDQSIFSPNVRPGGGEGSLDLLGKFSLRVLLSGAIAMVIGSALGSVKFWNGVALAGLAAAEYAAVSIFFLEETFRRAVTTLPDGTTLISHPPASALTLPGMTYDILVVVVIPLTGWVAWRVASRAGGVPPS